MQRESLNIAAVWRGDELFRRDDWLCELTGDDLGELSRAVSATFDRERRRVTATDFQLPGLGPRLAQVQDRLEHGSGAAWLRGLNLDGYSEEQAKTLFWGLAQHIGTPVSQSAAGDRIFHVRDAGFGKEDPRTRGPNTRRGLSFHTDRCDVIAFLCLRPAKSGGENQLVSSAAIYNQVLLERPDLLEELMRPYLYQRHNVDQGNQHAYCRQPIFSFREGRFAANLLRVLIERAYAMDDTPDMTDSQREALDFLESVAERPEMHVTFRLERGDMLFLNNWVTLHRRFEFEDHEQPALRRNLLRLWLSVPNSRPLDPAFLDNYGAVGAGQLRGGMRAADESKQE